jgi:hypothetical protein
MSRLTWSATSPQLDPAGYEPRVNSFVAYPVSSGELVKGPSLGVELLGGLQVVGLERESRGVDAPCPEMLADRDSVYPKLCGQLRDRAA